MDTVFVLNCGSSSIKFQLIEPESGKVHLKGLAENLGTDRATLKWGDQSQSLEKPDYGFALDEILKLLGDQKIIAIGHRVVHGGEDFSASVKIDKSVLDKILACNHLAPLHNPVNALGIKIMGEKFSDIPQVAVFDTAFHQTMPEQAYLYALPYALYEKHQVRRYGFHGTSHRYVVQEGAKKLGKPLEETAFVSCHLGNGCSVAAVLGGKSVDTSMGLTPLEGLVMGQRSGDLDPGAIPFLAEKLKVSVNEVTHILNKESGLLGLSGISEDMRLLLESSEPRAKLAINIFCYRLSKYIASYLIPLGKIDRVIFTGGIGENSARIRDHVMDLLSPLRLGSLVILTNEELMIARDAARIVKESP
ncbi:acetate/propionate family kinase [Candidatus Neptunochlamydia vexilliferae]|uniref:Acetate kinase n=1 Tax=Candidatus Neptunichlamydia vexilliferae TaxID=1651774 RepID=A0ABS0AZY7_9BACT|nr:acetate kinase [Candidatus Neptunochlamydia vexilliferae]MBF5059698.1 Acetate kinase [Candidatus Neptunochlamydia vexilliferae]